MGFLPCIRVVSLPLLTYNGGLQFYCLILTNENNMPIYAYRCSQCGHAKDVLQKMSDAPLSTCPACGQETFSKQITAAGFQLKGSGWYVTDFRGGSNSSSSSTESSSSSIGGETAVSSSTESSANTAPTANTSTTNSSTASDSSTPSAAPAA